MEKYRKWTDHATGINPFNQVQPPKPNIIFFILLKLLGVIKYIIFFSLFITLLLLHIFTTLIPIQFIKKQIIIKFSKTLIFMLGVYEKDDYNFNLNLNTLSKRNALFLSNSCSMLDTFYYMYTIYPLKFIVTHSYPDKQYKYQSINSLKAMKRLLFNRQPFFIFHTENETKYEDLKEVAKRQLDKGYNLIYFYEGIKTNGLGTIKPNKKQLQKIYSLESKLIVFNHLKYTSNSEINNMTKHPLVLLYMFLSSASVSLKIRSKIIDKQNINSVSQLNGELQQFVTVNFSKILDVNPESYFDFIEYYEKTKQI